jgi:transcriptional antiterminator NusG
VDVDVDEMRLNSEENKPTGASEEQERSEERAHPLPGAQPEEQARPERAGDERTPDEGTRQDATETPRAELEQEEQTLESETLVAPEAAEPAAQAPAPEGPKHAWYVVHCYSGYENRVKKSLEQRIISEAKQDLIFRVVVPTEEEIDVREGQRKVVQRRVFPGYVLVEMIQYHPEDQRAKEAWFTIRNTPGVTGFVSSGDRPTPLREDEVAKILKRMETDQPKVRVTYRPGQVVHIIDGPFADFRGTVDEVNMEKGKVRVMVSFFGRDTPVELDLLQVEKV